jgi:hypothetical protein
MNEVADNPEDLSTSGRTGVRWAAVGGESYFLDTDSFLAADGIENVMRILEDLEDDKFKGLKFVELNACSVGCLGGVLTVENPYIARVKLKKLRKNLPEIKNYADFQNKEKIQSAFWDTKPEYQPVFMLGGNMRESIKNPEIETLKGKISRVDCRNCVLPHAKPLAEDVVRE